MRVTAIVVRPSGQATVVRHVDAPDDLWFPDVDPVLRALRDEHSIEATVLSCVNREPLTLLLLARGELPVDEEPAWYQPQWYDEALPWIARHVTATGPWSQVRSWGLSNVLRIPTADGDVYFKALSDPSTRPDALPFLFANEPLFLRHASADRPGAVPAPIAIDEERRWMLLPDLGSPLANETDIALWLDAIRDHARLQRSYVDRPERLLEFSCVDRRLAVLDAELDRLLGPNPATDRLGPDERARLPIRTKQLREAITELASIGVPETLLHGDLHPRNLAVRDGRVRAFDWTDAAVAHPFLDLVTFVEERSPLSTDPRVRDAYLAEWEEFASPADLRRALELAEELGTLYQTMTSLHLFDHLTGPSQDSVMRGAMWWLERLLAVQDG
ncbi:aminoglycoside phosphotransferase family protein [Kribbella sp. NPDC004875]|uniref:aminoglycoside phosphotransferase family protein n=1 Tax=Kribbella sp. NPDC004875 TaxID=3364107 RepID=UPI00367833B8